MEYLFLESIKEIGLVNSGLVISFSLIPFKAGKDKVVSFSIALWFQLTI